MRLDERLARSPALRQQPVSVDPFAELKNRIHQELIAKLGPQLFAEGAESDGIHDLVEPEAERLLEAERGIARADRERLVEEIVDDTVGHGPLEKLLADDSITEIMVNGPHDVWVEREGRLYESAVRFIDGSHVRRIINKIVAQIGRRIDESSPMVDARLPDGSRVNAVIPPLSLSGPLVTIRKFSRRRLDLDELVRIGTLNRESVDFLERCIAAELNILISGGTGTGKTTLLNAVSAAIPDSERIITIEDAAELQLNQRHVLRLEARPKNVEGSGEIPVRELVRNSLRMRPDRIIVGEVRGAEALDMLQAMNTGHDGSLSTVHANSPRDALARVETMVLMAGFELPVRAIRQQVSAALELIVHLERLEDGVRRVTSIAEVQRMESDVITLQDIFKFEVERVDAKGSVIGSLEPTGIHPTFLEKFRKRGVELPPSLFSSNGAGFGDRPRTRNTVSPRAVTR
jgi:pilus assembly protein CpaF